MTGNVDVQLPGYMTSLPQHHIDRIRRNCCPTAQYVIAVGYDKRSGDIVMLTSDGKFLEISVEQNGLPPLHCVPIDHGQTVLFPDIGMKISTKRLIEMSKATLAEVTGC